MSSGPAPSIDSLAVRVTALETQGDKILAKLDVLGDKMGSAGKPQWAVIIAGLAFMVTVLGYIGTSWKAPLDTTVARQEADIRALQATVVPRAEHAERQRQLDEMLAAMRERVTRDMQSERNATVEGEKRLAERIERLENRFLYAPGSIPAPGKRTELTTRTTP